jgi:hypothetical protein
VTEADQQKVLEALQLSRIDDEPTVKLSPKGALAVFRALRRAGFKIVEAT